MCESRWLPQLTVIIHVSSFNNIHNLYSLSGRGVFLYLKYIPLEFNSDMNIICKAFVNLHLKSDEII